MKNDIFGTQIISGNYGILVMTNMLFKYIGCVVSIGIIGGNCFGVKKSESGEKRYYQVSF